MPSEEIIQVVPSTLENIDKAVYKFVNESINAHTTTNKGFTKVPVLWMGTERAYQIKNNKDLRDSVGKLKLPLITTTRASVSRDDDFRGAYRSYYPPGTESPQRVEITRVIKQDKTRNYANAAEMNKTKGDPTGPDHPRTGIIYETIMVPIPTYVTCMYEVNIRTEYQQQMNDILPIFLVDEKNVAVIDNHGYSYEAFIDGDYSTQNNAAALGTEERMFTAKVKIKVLGYITGDGENSNTPAITRRQNAIKVVISKERVIVGDKRPWAEKIPGDDGNYREF